MPTPLPPRRRAALTPYKALAAKVRAVVESVPVQKTAKAMYGGDLDFR
jgi:hypothetical protein